jgi:hypothetical protein
MFIPPGHNERLIQHGSSQTIQPTPKEPPAAQNSNGAILFRTSNQSVTKTCHFTPRNPPTLEIEQRKPKRHQGGDGFLLAGLPAHNSLGWTF